MTEERPILYSFRRCPYAMRARMAIAVSGQVCALREVVLRDKPAEMLEASPKATVPVVVLPDGKVIEESLEVMHWALGESDPEGWLVALEDEEVRALIAENDGPFKSNLDRYKYANRYENVDPLEERAQGLAFLEKLDARLANQPYLCGENFTFADAAIAPFVRQFANADMAWFQSQDLKNLQKWLEAFLTSERFTGVMEKFPAWKSGLEEPLFPAGS